MKDLIEYYKDDLGQIEFPDDATVRRWYIQRDVNSMVESVQPFLIKYAHNWVRDNGWLDLDVTDVIQEINLLLLEKLQAFNPGMGSLLNNVGFWANIAVMRLMESEGKHIYDAEYPDSDDSGGWDTFMDTESDELGWQEEVNRAIDLQNAMDSLSDQQRAVLEMRLAGRDFVEIAEELGLNSVGSVHTTLARAVKNLGLDE